MSKKKKIVRENVSNISPKSSMSYEQYLKAAFEILSSNLSLRVYKLAHSEDYPFFERGKDVRVKIYWKKDPIYEFIVERTFFYQSNRNKEDRKYMRGWADCKVKMLKNCLTRIAKPKKKVTKKVTYKTKTKVGSTQDAFEKMKSK